MKEILITGSNGFLGKNLISGLKERKFSLNFFDKENTLQELESFVSKADFIYHLAGVNRPENPKEFYKGNHELTKKLIETIKEKKIPLVYASSTQAELDNDYGKSKRLAELEIIKYSEKNAVPVFVYRLPNLFGKWSKPNYNSVVATFCHNISRNLPIYISDPENELSLTYIDDVVQEFLNILDKNNFDKRYSETQILNFNKTHKIKLGDLAEKIKSFENMRKKIQVPEFSDQLTKFLYSTYLSYLPKDSFAVPLKLNKDQRGSFIEFVKTQKSGQFSASTTNPGQKIVRGNHYHNTKTEKFFVLKGEASVKFRDIFTDEIIEYIVSENEPKSIDIPPGYTHSIENIGNTEMILLLWANEQFDPEKPDTHLIKVEENE